MKHLMVWALLSTLGLAGIATTLSSSSARPTAIPPGQPARPGQMVTVGGWQDGLYVGPQKFETIKQFKNENLMTFLRVRGNMVEEFRISANVSCENRESGTRGTRRFLSSHASLQSFLRLNQQGVAEARIPMTDSFRWMQVYVKLNLLGDKGKLTVTLQSIPDPEASDPLIEDCIAGYQNVEIKHTPPSAMQMPQELLDNGFGG